MKKPVFSKLPKTSSVDIWWNRKKLFLEDVKEFYNKFYGASNASLVIAGDINIEETKDLVKKWFGEIPSGPKVEDLNFEPVKLAR
mgnify:CR=1 FL=1